MPTLTMTVAGHPLRIEYQHAATESRLADFCTPDTPDALPICVTREEIAAECARLGTLVSEAHGESLAIERAVAHALAPLGVAHMHAVALAVDRTDGGTDGGTDGAGREACLFLADSGEGKSTHVRHWMHLLGDRVRVVADDKPFLSFAEDTLLVHGSPWRGKEGWGDNPSVPVRCFCILRRGTVDSIRRATSAEAMQELFRRTLLPEDECGAAAVLSVVDKVLSSIPFWCLSCTDSPHAAEVAYSALFERN